MAKQIGPVPGSHSPSAERRPQAEGPVAKGPRRRSRRSMRPRRRRRQWAIGVDLGGTWVRVIALDARDRRRAFKGPSPGLGGLPALLRRLCRRWTLEPDDVRRLVV